MNRRHFLAATALAGIAPGPFSRRLLAEAPNRSALHAPSKLKLPLLKQLLSTPQTGFPTVTPQFAVQFGPGSGAIQMVRSETLADFEAQIQAQAGNGYVLSALTTIQNMNRTWFYGAFKTGANANNFQFISTTDPNAFQQAFTQYQSGYTLVDFNIAWQRGQLIYTGYWLASAANPKQTLVWDLDYADLSTQWTSLSASGMRMMKVQAYPQKGGTVYSAIFAPSTAGYYLYNQPVDTFFTTVGNTTGNTLSGMAFDPVQGRMIGCWLNKATPSQFVSNQTWETLTATAAAASGMVVTAMAAYPNAPDFDDFFQTNEAPFVEGYAYAVALNGNIIANGGGFSRNSAQPNNPNTPFTPDSRMNIASSSKVIAGLATQALIQQNPSITIDSPFWPLIQSMVPSPDPSVKVVTLRQLASMTSGLAPYSDDGPLSPPAPYTDIWGYLKSYLAQPLAGTPGKTYNYNNTNFTILQGVIQLVSGMDFVAFVSKYVFAPAGVDTTIYNATPDPQAVATLGYSGPTDKLTGQYWTADELTFVAAGGFITNVREMIKILMALRGTSILPQAVITETLNDLVGWDGIYQGAFGTYYQKNGGLENGLNPPQWMGSATVRLSEGYDVVLLANSGQPTQPGTNGSMNIINMVINAFESRGVPLASEPANAPYITTVVQGASFLPNCAPSAYLSIIGNGFPGPAVAWDPTTTLPTELNGVQVQVGSQYAYIAYAGPTQINFLLPSTVPAGLQNVEVTMPAGGMQSSVQINAVAPGLFAYMLNGNNYPAALIAGSAVVVAAAGALSSPSRPATAGDFVELYGTGMGPTNPAAPDGVVFSQAYPASNLSAFQVTIGGIAATVTFAGLVGPGLFQIDIQIPNGLNGGDQPIVLTVNGIAAQPNLMLTISA